MDLSNIYVQLGIIFILVLVVILIIYSKKNLNVPINTISPTTSSPTQKPTTSPPTQKPTTSPPTQKPTTSPTSPTSRPYITLKPTQPPTSPPPTSSPTTSPPERIDCVVSEWVNSGICGPCGVQTPIGKKIETRTILKYSQNGGLSCPELTRYVDCECPIINVNPLPTTLPPVNCIVSDWNPWTTCSASCGGGTQTRTRNVITPSQNGGNSCPLLSETQSCNTQECQIQSPPVNCTVSDWNPWTTCSTSCGGGTQTRTRNVITPSQNGGNSCPLLSETQSCNTQQCVDPIKISNCCNNYCNTNVDITRYPPPQGRNMYNYCINNCNINPSNYNCNI